MHFHGRRTIRLWTDSGVDIVDAIDRIGHVPLPPYIKRPDRPSDRERYQTVYARERGSIAAPTAGLHFTDETLAALAARGVERAEVTLHVGYGTFKPIRAARVEDHVVDPETFIVTDDAAAQSRARARDGRRVDRGGHDDGARAGVAWRSQMTGASRQRSGRDDIVHSPRSRVPHRQRPHHQLPPAAVVAARARGRIRGPRTDSRHVP